jgi:hypothetical protein
MYSSLQPERIFETIAALERRIGERFPGSGLSRVGAELRRLAGEAEALAARLRRPIWPLRLAAALGIVAALGVTASLVLMGFRVLARVEDVTVLLTATESAVNEVILLVLAIAFLVSLETRAKRRRALRSLHRLRSIVHIVDMHQLTKDPESVLSPRMATASSPARDLTRFELVRYLDYCSELLSLTAKLAALHVQHLNDPVVLSAVNDVEALASSLSNKVWQKIMILDVALIEKAAPRPG